MIYLIANVIACLLIFSACKSFSEMVYVGAGVLILVISLVQQIKQKLMEILEDVRKGE